MVSKLLDANTANIEKAESLTAGLSAAQMNWRPQPGKWSIAQNLAHLNFGYPGLDTIASSIAAARAKGIIGNGPFRYGWLSSWIMKSQEASAEIYDPQTGTFGATGNMTSRREWHTATGLNDGSVLITGGLNWAGVGTPFLPLASAELYVPSATGLQQAITAMKTAAGTDSLNLWEWAYYWQYLPAFQGAPAGFGVVGSISPAGMEQIIVAAGGQGFRMVSAEQWVLNYRQAALDSWQQAITAMKAAAGTDSLNFWYWAWYWQYLPAFSGAPAGFGVVGSISPAFMEQIIMAGGGDGFQKLSAEQWLLYYRQSVSQ